MASNLFLKTRQCLVWRTEKPNTYNARHSPRFTAMGRTWSFKMVMITENKATKYKLFIDCGMSTDVKQFRVKTYLEDPRNEEKDSVLYNYQLVTHAPEQIWMNTVTDIRRHITDFERHDDITIVCSLLGFSETVVLPRYDRSVQTVFSLRSMLLDPSPNYESLSTDFRNLLDKDVMSDVQLKSGQHVVSAHKIILAARSEVFKAMFQHQTAENKSGVVDIKDMDPPVLEAFLKYLYSGKVPDDVAEDMVPKLYAAGDKYAVWALRKICSDFMVRNMQEDNFISILALADAHSDDDLKEVVADFLVKNKILLASDAWIAYSKENPKLGVEIYQKYIAETILK